MAATRYTDDIIVLLDDLSTIIPSVTPYENALDAFQGFLNHSLSNLKRVEKPALSFATAIKESFYVDDTFSWKRAGILSGSVAIGVTAALFCVRPAAEAGETIVKFIQEKTGHTIAASRLLIGVFSTANTLESTAIATLSALAMLEAYIGNATQAEKFLNFQSATRGEQIKNIARKTFELSCATAANIPTFLITLQTNVVLAIFSSIANITLSRQGLAGLSIIPHQMPPAKYAMVKHLQEQLDIFLAMPFSQQMKNVDHLYDCCASDDAHNAFLNCLFNFGKSVNETTAEDTLIQIQTDHPVSWGDNAIIKATAIAGTVAELPFVEYSGMGTARLFKQKTSPEAIMAGITAALLTLLPCGGFGYITGRDAGEAATSKKTSLAYLYTPKVRTALKWLIGCLSVFAGGTNFTMANDAMLDFSDAIKWKGPLEEILRISTSGVCYVGAAIESGFYTLKILDKILIYFAQRCGNEQIRRLITAVGEMRRVTDMLTTMTDDNYREVLTWMMGVSPHSKSSADAHHLADLLHVIFDHNLNEFAYEKLHHEGVIKARTTLPPYQLLQPPVTKARHETQLRRRKHCCGLFSRSKKKVAEEASVELRDTLSFL